MFVAGHADARATRCSEMVQPNPIDCDIGRYGFVP